MRVRGCACCVRGSEGMKRNESHDLGWSFVSYKGPMGVRGGGRGAGKGP